MLEQYQEARTYKNFNKKTDKEYAEVFEKLAESSEIKNAEDLKKAIEPFGEQALNKLAEWLNKKLMDKRDKEVLINKLNKA
jgi:hypothetical protein